MARVSLLHRGDGLGQRATFDFEHMMSHRQAFGVMSPLSRFSTLPYMLEPTYGLNKPASSWHLNHQQAHNDALNNIPSQYYWQYIATTIPNPTPPPPTITTQTSPTITYGLRVGQNLIDTDLDNLRQKTWWIFENHQEHMLASQVIAPAPAPKPAPQWMFPFW